MEENPYKSPSNPSSGSKEKPSSIWQNASRAGLFIVLIAIGLLFLGGVVGWAIPTAIVLAAYGLVVAAVGGIGLAAQRWRR